MEDAYTGVLMNGKRSKCCNALRAIGKDYNNRHCLICLGCGRPIYDDPYADDLESDD